MYICAGLFVLGFCFWKNLDSVEHVTLLNMELSQTQKSCVKLTISVHFIIEQCMFKHGCGITQVHCSLRQLRINYERTVLKCNGSEKKYIICYPVRNNTIFNPAIIE
jgi:hypothetical protein